jgi:RHS repeat-associated protein
MQMPGRKYSATTSAQYRYGFNGKENDNEVKGEGNQQDYGLRIYDTRLGKFLSVDPLSKKYPHYTPYSFAGNKPIVFIDLDGAEECSADAIMMRDDKALLEGSMTTKQYRDNQVARGMGALIGAAIVADAFVAKGKATQTLFKIFAFANVFNGIGWEHSSENTKDPVLKQHQQEMAINSYKGAIVDAGVGKFVGVATKILSVAGEAVYKTFSTASIRTTQTTVNGVEKYVVEFTKAGKYIADPVDIVKMEDGIYSSVDHARLMAAEKLGLKAEANAHNFNDPIPYKRAREIAGDKVDDADLPNTWGDAIKVRVNGQGKKYSSENPNGSFDRPKVKS